MRHPFAVVVAAAMGSIAASGSAIAQTAGASAATPAPGPVPAGTAVWQEGFVAIPSVGVHTFQGDSGSDMGPGLRLGLLLGSRMAEIWSLNVGFAFDIANFDVPPGVSASSYILDIGFHPLLHFPLANVHNLEIVAGPLGGIVLSKGSGSIGFASGDTWAYGWTVGANAGAFYPVGPVKLGLLINFFLRTPLKSCVTAGGTDMCFSENLESSKTLAFALAALL